MLHIKREICGVFLSILNILVGIISLESELTWWLAVSDTLTSREPDRTAYQLVPMSPCRNTVDRKKNIRNHVISSHNPTSCAISGVCLCVCTNVHTRDAFLQAFVEGTSTDLQQERRWEPVEGFDLSQSGQDNVHILSRALRGPAEERTIIRSDVRC